MLSKESLNELAIILKEDYGRDLTPQEVFEVGTQLISFFEILIKWDREDKKREDCVNTPGSIGVDLNQSKMV